jgi:predicted negative regulator of RcsB-dependent stress response
MSRYETDEEQWEAIKRWWHENGKQLLLAVIVTLAAVTGWNYWQQVQYAKAVNASATFEILQMKAAQGQFKEVAREARKLMAEHPESPYASGAALLLATWLYDEQRDLKGALEQLTWVSEHAPETGMKDIAHLRAARLLADARQFDEAQAQLKHVAVAGLAPESRALYDYVRGEIALFKGDLKAAREAFAAVQTNDKADVGLKQLAQLQLDDLTEDHS